MENKIIEIAIKEIGYIEDKNNSTKYGKWFGLDKLAWCGIFTSWVYFKAGFKMPVIGFDKGFASCQLFYEWAKKNNKIVSDPQSGDIVLFDWNGDNRFDHVGLFDQWKVKNKSFHTIEGNTSLKNQSNGGMVMQRLRTVKTAVFVRI
jgi:hypothetical protein